MKHKLFLFLVLFFLISLSIYGQEDYDNIEGASQIEVYKTIDSTSLRLWIFNPPEMAEGEKYPAIIFYFGGGWSGGTPKQFVKHSEYLAQRGMIAIVADYRVRKRHGVLVNDCVSDAKSSIRYLRKHADRLQIDPDKLVSAGGSAGGHLAASVATLPAYDDPMDDTSISSIPNASVLFNPVLVLAEILGKFNLKEGFSATLQKRMNVPLESMSPYHHIKKGIGPMLIFHGTDDTTVPFVTAELFNKKMIEVGNKCSLVSYYGEGHGFFNYQRNGNAPYIDTVKRMDDFLVGLGYINAVAKTKVY